MESEVDITVVLDQLRKISTVRFTITAADNSQTLADGVAKVVSSPPSL